ncbi:FAD binding domain-containing protein [Aquibacillus koreensis]|uniref:FAD binding domain-containing protein n=1 Tax=Aquibacillus koreensis TaxID=279446 RepID=A0A9X3WK44_9BACI|nr:FAD binding domain-containing protein [Aquibacillus koreensis]MCT2537792.1 FAD binding domain-containing protein [Aquibacillus koreensis]MDC3421175.1 FAD binding domain-containing protein [Aquibacillus koreensis]
MDNGNLVTENATQTLATKVWMPKSIKEAYELKVKYDSNAILIAGGTLIQLQREQGNQLPAHLISLEKIDELKEIHYFRTGSENKVSIGALSSLAMCMNHPIIAKEYPIMVEAIKGIASPSIRNRATIGGNVRYGIGDIIPALLSLDAKVTWFDGRKYNTNELSTFLEVMKKDKNIILTQIDIPTKWNGLEPITFYKKVGRRQAFIPSIVTVSLICSIDLRKKITAVRIAAGGGGTTPKRLVACENKLQDLVITEALLEDVYDLILEEYKPTGDPFATESYRKSVLANLIVAELEQLIS